MKVTLAFLFLVGLAFAANTPAKPVRLREVSLQKIPLLKGERIASLEFEVAGASFDSVRIPVDWSIEVGAPISGVAKLRGQAAHGVGMPFTAEPFQRFVVLALSEDPQRSLSITAKLGLYLYSEKRESERTIVLSSDSIVVREPNQSLEPTPTSVTSAAEQPPRRP